MAIYHFLEEKMFRRDKTSSMETKIIGVAGAGSRIGCTHTCIVLANRIHAVGCRVAILEENQSRCFPEIAEEYECDIDSNGKFTYQSIDYYTYRHPRLLPLILRDRYEYLIVDHGDFDNCDKDFFLTNHINIIVCGSRPWEMNEIENIFETVNTEEVLEAFHYCFNFAHDNFSLQRSIKKAMGTLQNVYFPPYTEDVFHNSEFSDLDNCIGIKMPDNIPKSEGIRLIGNVFGRKKEYKENDGFSHSEQALLPEYSGQEILMNTNSDIKEVASPKQEETTEIVSPICQETITQPEDDIPEMPQEEKEIIPATEECISTNTEEILKTETSADKENIEEAKIEAETEPKSEQQSGETNQITCIESTEPEKQTQEPVSSNQCVNEYKTDNIEESIVDEDLLICFESELHARELFSKLLQLKAFAKTLSDRMDTSTAQKIQKTIEHQISYAFVALLRAGVECTRERGKSGQPVLRIKSDSLKYEVNEEYIKKSAGDDQYLILPAEDNFQGG